MTESGRRFAIVTGASGGIGRATALRLSEDGYDIIAHYRTRQEAAETLREQITAKGGICWLVRADLARESDIRTLVDEVTEIVSSRRDRALSVLVNNAALLLGPSFAEASLDDFDSYFAVNTRAPFFLTQALAPLMHAGGSIVNISSAGAHFSSPGDIVYAMSKAAVESFTKNAAQALAEHGIRINAVVPGFTENGHPAFNNTDVRAYMGSHSVLGDVSAPETVAEAVAFLASNRANRTTGTILDVSGGSTLGARLRTGSSLSLRKMQDASLHTPTSPNSNAPVPR